MLVQNMVERGIQVFRWDGAKLWPGVTLDMGAGPACHRHRLAVTVRP